jgi:uncharacterized protein (TIGR00369 family)
VALRENSMTDHPYPTAAETEARLLAEGWELETDEGFIGFIGPFWRRPTGERTIELCFPTDKRHHNLRGVLQGGALMAFADRATGRGCRFFTGSNRTATVNLDVNFVDAVQIGEIVHARPEVIRATKTICFMRTELTVGNRVVATAQGVWKLLKPLAE